jgi:regulator of sigma E protease
MSDFLLAVISFLIVLGPIILIHEFGHFIALRLTGVTVLEFGIGFPPRAVKLFEWRGTEFTLNWLPLGGFVRPLGEDMVKPLGPEATDEERKAFEKQQAELEQLGKKTIKTKSVFEAGPWQRMFYLGAGAGANFISAFLILVIAAMIGRQPPAAVVIDSATNSPAAAADIKLGDIVTAVNGEPVKTAEAAKKLFEESYGSQITLTVLREGKTQDITLKPTEVAFPKGGVLIDSVVKESPAAAVFEPGDIILKVGARSFMTTDSLKAYIDEHLGEPLKVTFDRSGEEKTAEIIPRKNPPANQGPMGVTIIGLEYDVVYGVAVADGVGPGVEPVPFGDAVRIGAQQTGDFFTRVVAAPIMIIRGQISGAEARPVSPIGISQIGGAVLRQSVERQTPNPILNFAALISIAVGITNLLPIPGLDGGRILFVIIELLRGKPMDPEREGMVHLVGIILLLGLAAIFIVNDLVSPIPLDGLTR